MTLWSIFRSPLIMGGDLPTLDDATRALRTNPEVIAVNQHGRIPHVVISLGRLRVSSSRAPAAGDHYLAVFNLDSVARRVALPWNDVGLRAGRWRVRDVWARTSRGTADSLHADLPAHGSSLLRVSTR
ncbi:MAG: hypothetical protein ABI664_04200 [bacterium]